MKEYIFSEQSEGFKYFGWLDYSINAIIELDNFGLKFQGPHEIYMATRGEFFVSNKIKKTRNELLSLTEKNIHYAFQDISDHIFITKYYFSKNKKNCIIELSLVKNLKELKMITKIPQKLKNKTIKISQDTNKQVSKKLIDLGGIEQEDK